MNIQHIYVLAVLVMAFSGNVIAGYQYTYTGNHFSYLYNLQGNGSFTGTSLMADDEVTVVIRSNDVLSSSTNYFTDATVEFFSSNYYKKAMPSNFSGPVAKLSQLEISSFDANGLPLTWSLRYNEFTNTELNPDYKAYQGYGFSSFSDGVYQDDSASYVLVEPIAQENVFTTYGQSDVAGKWTISQFDGPVSPVPEAPASMMFLTGLGVLAYLVQQKKSKAA
jgi:hypothetical protein